MWRAMSVSAFFQSAWNWSSRKSKCATNFSKNASSIAVSSARSSVKIDTRRLRAMRAPALAALLRFSSRSTWSHSPRLGWMVPSKATFSSLPGWKSTPGLRTSWETTTRSVPLMMNVPCSVMMGKSPMKTVCSLISPVSELRKRARTKTGWL